MGEAADMAYDAAMNEEICGESPEDLGVWIMRDGTKIAIEDMETSHIENSLAMLKRNGFVGPNTVMAYLTTSGPQGEAACEGFDREMNDVFSSPVSQYIDLFEAEIKKRATS